MGQPGSRNIFLKTDMTLDVTRSETGQRPNPGHCPVHLKKIEALRDFFDAADSRDIEQAFTRLSRCFRKGHVTDQPGECLTMEERPGKEKPGIDRPGMPQQNLDIPWLEIEYQFNRLFVGPGQVKAPPYASVYLEKQPILMGPTTLGIRGIYASLGLEAPDRGRIPDDFIAYELDALSTILTGNPHNAPVMDQLLDGHMIRWIPKFCDRCRQHPHLLYPLKKTIEWLEWTIKALHVEMCSKTNEKRPFDEYQTQNH